MFHLIDTALGSLLRAELPAGTDVSFETPPLSWAELPPERPTVNLFLHTIREDTGTRVADWIDIRDDRGHVVARQKPPRWYRVWYALTAWAVDAEREHWLLGASLGALAAQEAIPADHCGALVSGGSAVALSVAGPDPETSWAEVWSALGIRPRCHLDVMVTAAMTPTLLTDLAAPPSAVELGVDRTTGWPEPDQESPAESPATRVREKPNPTGVA